MAKIFKDSLNKSAHFADNYVFAQSSETLNRCPSSCGSTATFTATTLIPKSKLSSNHLDELLASSIDPDLAALNFESIDGLSVYDRLCYSEKLERRNDSRLAQKWLNRYSHCESGGWWASGLDPLNGWQPMSWGCFKPDHPKEDYEKPGKFIKYEHLTG